MLLADGGSRLRGDKAATATQARGRSPHQQFPAVILRVAGCIIAALKHGRAGEIYNAVDDEPVSQIDFFRWLAATLGKPLPPSISEDVGIVRKRGVTNKRVSNAKLRAELKYEFQFPDFRKGYAAEIARLGKAR